jgi:hypothetical protein
VQKSVEKFFGVGTGEKRLKVFHTHESPRSNARPAEETENETVKERIDDEDRIEKHRWNYENEKISKFYTHHRLLKELSPARWRGRVKIKDLLIH